MDIEIDLQPLIDFFNLPTGEIALRLLVLFGWIPVAFMIMWLGRELWLKHIRVQWFSGVKFVLLAIDIPKGNEQTPKAVENIFTYFSGTHSNPDLAEKWWIGKFQLSFSFEIVSIEGYTQFLVRTPEIYRNLVESAVYSQYPDAEITEVNDYTEGFPTQFPDEEWDLFGTEWVLKNKWVYPIKTYPDFEVQAAGKDDAPFVDPMSSLMDLCSSLGKGENFWFQIVVIPTGFDWASKGDKEIGKILGENKGEVTLANKIVDKAVDAIAGIGDAFFTSEGSESKSESKDESMKMMNLKPKEKKQIEAIHEKSTKIGFEVKMRQVYIAKKEIMNKPKVANGFVGYMKQFADNDLNFLKTDSGRTSTSVGYIMQESRAKKKKNSIIRNYIARDDWAGRQPYVLNVEELATLWHFPVESYVKAPLIQKAPGRKAEAPMSLPVGEEIVSEQILEPIFEEVDRKRTKEKQKSSELEVREDNDSTIFMSEDKQAVQEKDNDKGQAPGNLPIG